MVSWDHPETAVITQEDGAAHEYLTWLEDTLIEPVARLNRLTEARGFGDDPVRNAVSLVTKPTRAAAPAAGRRPERRPASRNRPVCGYAGMVTPEKLADLARLRRARDLMDREYASPLDVAMLARTALMSTAHFSRQFRDAYGETPYAYLMTRRIERAKALLRRGDLSVTEVCLAVGCTSLGSFSARFTQLVGQTNARTRRYQRTNVIKSSLI